MIVELINKRKEINGLKKIKIYWFKIKRKLIEFWDSFINLWELLR